MTNNNNEKKVTPRALASRAKNPQFLPNPYETWGKYSPYEVIILPKFHKNWAKIVDFLLGHSDFRITFLIKLQLFLLAIFYTHWEPQNSK